MNRKGIIFIPLRSSHFPLLLKWLETPHVKAWWDPAIQWTPQAIEEKYASYVRGYKRLILKEQVIEKPMNAFVIQIHGQDIGYIQYYNRHDFPLEQGYEMMDLPASCAAFDMYIGEAEFVGKGWGAKVLHLFLEEHVFKKFEYVFVDPDTANLPAIKAYEKAGFKPLGKEENNPITQMIKDKSLFHTIQRLEFSLLKTQMRHNPAYLAMLIEDTFIEIGKSGRVYTQ